MALLCAACERPTTRLLEVDAVQREEDGRTLSVIGRGFPGSHEGTAELSGTLYRPGDTPRALSVELPAHALSDELLRIDLASAALAQYSGLFEGKLEIRFESSAGDSEVVGSLSSVRVRVDGREQRDPAAQLSLLRRARAFHRSQGALELEATQKGLVLASLREKSPLAEAGASEGDRIERIDGAPVERVIDLLPRDEGSPHVLDVVKRRGGNKVRLALPGVGRTQPPSADLLWLSVLVSGLGALLLAPPARRVTSAAGPASLRYGAPALTLGTFLLSTRMSTTLDLRWLLGPPFVALLLTLSVAFARRLVPSQAALEHIVRLSAASLALASLTVLSGNLTPTWTSPSDAASFSHWPLVSSPAAWLALLVLVGATPPAPRHTALKALLEWARLSTFLAVAALSMSAGLTPLGTMSWLATPAVGMVILLVKVSLLVALVDGLQLRVHRHVLVGLSLACPLLSWLFMSFPATQELTLPFGGLLLGFWAVQSLRARLTPRMPAVRDPGLAPFL